MALIVFIILLGTSSEISFGAIPNVILPNHHIRWKSLLHGLKGLINFKSNTTIAWIS